MPVVRFCDLFHIGSAGRSHQHQRQAEVCGNLQILAIDFRQCLTVRVIVNQGGMDDMFVQRDLEFVTQTFYNSAFGENERRSPE